MTCVNNPYLKYFLVKQIFCTIYAHVVCTHHLRNKSIKEPLLLRHVRVRRNYARNKFFNAIVCLFENTTSFKIDYVVVVKRHLLVIVAFFAFRAKKDSSGATLFRNQHKSFKSSCRSCSSRSKHRKFCSAVKSESSSLLEVTLTNKPVDSKQRLKSQQPWECSRISYLKISMKWTVHLEGKF